MCLLGSKVELKPLNSSTRLWDKSKLADSGQGPPNVLELLFFGQCTLNYNKRSAHQPKYANHATRGDFGMKSFREDSNMESNSVNFAMESFKEHFSVELIGVDFGWNQLIQISTRNELLKKLV